MKLNLYRADLNSLSADKLISDLVNRDRSQKHIIITTDKSSLYYERRLFEILQEESFFDVSVSTLSRFANKVINKHDKILSKQGGVLIVKRILMENKSVLRSFAKSSDMIGFAGSLFDTICMFKSCHILPEQIESVKYEALNNKLQDIKFVYEKYEEYLKKEYTDSFNRLNLCAMNITKEKFENTNIYFVGFDDFTKQGYSIIERLIKCANSVSVATTFSKKDSEKHNKNIYLNQVFLNMLDIANMIGVKSNIVDVESSLDNERKFLANELLGNKPSRYFGENNYINLLKYENMEDEIKNTILSIKNNIIKNNFRYRNFAIVVSDFNRYKSKLKEYLGKLDVNYFIDESIKLKETTFSRFVSNLISILYKPTKYNVELFLKSIFLNIKTIDIDKYITHIDIYEPQYDNLFKTDIDGINNVFNILLKHRVKKENGNISDLLENIAKILDELKVYDRVEYLLEEYYTNNNIEDYRLLKQSVSKTIKVFDEIKVISDYECDYQDLLKFFDLFAENVTIVVPPITTDAVFVTGLDCENLNDADYVYFLGFNEGIAPRYNVDSGIISDDEIEKMPLKSRLSPTINIINKRLKFKLFELMFVAKKKIYISYLTKMDGEAYPNAIINSLKIIYGVNDIKNYSNVLDIVNNNIVSFDRENFAYNNPTQKIATDNYVELLKYWDNYNDNKNYIKSLSILNKIVGDKTYIENMRFSNILKPITYGLFLNKNKVGISQIEKFNSCPYSHFVDYGLRLKSNEKNDMSAIDLGNIIHEFVKIAVKNLENADVFAILSKILEKSDYKYLVENPKNNFVIKSLYEEVQRIYGVLKYQQSISSFKTKDTELPFNLDICEIGGRKIVLTGIVDRVDEFNGGIRVIDYKTGSIEFKNYDDIYYGNKVQVVVYMSALAEKNNLKPLGALYFPISNAFAVDKCEELYQMQGVVEKSIENIIAFDNNLAVPSYSSDIINLSTTTKGEISSNPFYKNMCLEKDDIDKLTNFVMSLIKKTIDNIDKHIISPNPIDEHVCDYCEYRGLCNFSTNYKNEYKEVRKIKSLDELLEVEDE